MPGRSKMMDRQRVKHACEPCRRKKTKCPGEKPICSFCQRLKQNCVYLDREEPKAVVGSRVVKSRPRTLTRRQTTPGPQARQLNDDSRDEIHTDETTSLVRRQAHSLSSHWSFDNIEPPEGLLDYLIQIYKSKIHFQPLPLFRLDGLRARFSMYPRYLRFSFLALAIHYSDHPYYAGLESDAIEFYAKSAQRSVDDVVAEGAVNINILQALCLLSLHNVLAQQAQAWMNIGSAARLQVLHRLSLQDEPGSHREADIHMRCYWSIFLLETIFTPQYTLLRQDPNPPGFPASFPVPASIPAPPGQVHRQDRVGEEQAEAQDMGINAYCIRAISVWGEIATYLHAVRCGRIENAWSSSSTFNQLTIKLYDLDTQVYKKHLLRHAEFPNRHPDELSEDLEYWRPWILMQFVFHGSYALLNHPFVHLLALRGDSRTAQSGFFLQKTIDQALFHSSWIARLIDMCEGFEPQVNDPLIGHIVAATYTISWILQFSRDHKVAAGALDGMAKCESFIERISGTWPHIGYQLEVIRNLQSTADSARKRSSADSTDITFKPSMVWKVLDYSISRLSTARLSPKEQHGAQTDNVNVTLHVDTTLVHPLDEEQPEQDDLLARTSGIIGDPDIGFWDPFLDNFHFDFSMSTFT